MTDPSKHAKQRLIRVAAQLALGKPLLGLEQLGENAGRTLGRRALLKALNAANDSLHVLAIELRDVFNELNEPPK